MAVANPYDPLKKVTPPIGAPVQNIGGLAPNTAPVANKPVAPPAVREATPGPAPVAPAPAPVAAPVAAPAPAPLPAPIPQAPGASSAASVSGAYGRSGGVSPGTSATLEDQLRNYITGSMGGVTSKAFIDRAKQQLGSAVEGQRAQGVNRINEDAIRRGLFKSGIPSEGIAAAETGARGALSQGIADILSKAEQQDIAGRESAAGTAGNLLGMNRQWDMYEQERADRAAAQAAANRQPDTGFTYIDPDTGESYQMDESWF